MHPAASVPQGSGTIPALISKQDLLGFGFADQYETLAHLGLLSGLDDDAVSGVVEFPGNYAQKFCLVLVAIVI